MTDLTTSRRPVDLRVALDADLGLDDVIPHPDFRSRHQRLIPAPPEHVWSALSNATINTHPVVRILVGARQLPGRFAGAPLADTHQRRTLIEMAPYPIVSITPGRCVVLAGVGQPWKLSTHRRPPALSAAAVSRFSTPGWTKVAMDIRLEPAPTGTTISTETRVLATDRHSRRDFAAYWAMIRWPSALLRHIMLSAVANQARQSQSR